MIQFLSEFARNYSESTISVDILLVLACVPSWLSTLLQTCHCSFLQHVANVNTVFKIPCDKALLIYNASSSFNVTWASSNMLQTYLHDHKLCLQRDRKNFHTCSKLCQETSTSHQLIISTELRRVLST